MDHFRLRQRMTLTIKIYCSRLGTVIFILFFFFNFKPTSSHRYYRTVQLLGDD
jgi:hypothetical protein